MKGLILFSGMLMFTLSCDMGNEVKTKLAEISQYKKKALNLAKENRNLRAKISQLKYQIQALEAKNNFLKISMRKGKSKRIKREIASVKPSMEVGKDYVNDNTYRWSASQLLSIAESEFENKNYEKASQFFHTFLKKYSKKAASKDHNFDSVLFQAGLSAYESGRHYDWAAIHLEHLIKRYPDSKYFRGAKLWLGLTELRRGDKAKFYKMVEEFRMKYRNTPEWKILSGYYEEFTLKYK